MRKVLAHADRRVVSAIIAAAAFATPTPQATVPPRRLRPEADEAAIVRLVDAVLLEFLSAMILSSGRPRPSDAELLATRHSYHGVLLIPVYSWNEAYVLRFNLAFERGR